MTGSVRMQRNEPSRAVLYRVLAILTGLCISIGGFALGFVLESIQTSIEEIRIRIAPDILPRAQERFQSVDQRIMRIESDIMDAESEIRRLRDEVNQHMRTPHE